MTDIVKLADVYSFSSEVSDRAALQSAIEALQSDRDQLQRDFTYMKQQRDAMQAENEGLKDSFNSVLELLKEKDAAPKALEPLTDEQAHEAIREWCGDLNDDDEPSELDIVRAIEAAHGITKGTP